VRTLPLSDLVELVRGNIMPSRFSSEEFTLYSIPAYDRGVPETVPGAQVGSAKTLVKPADVLFSKLNPRIPRVWVVATAGDGLRSICSTEFLPLRIKSPLISPMVNGGASFKDVSDVLGHKSITTTLIYAKLDLKSLMRVALPWPGGAR
jgi:hypothetical protein